MAQMGTSTASTVELSVEAPALARALLATQGTKAQVAKQRVHATTLQHLSISASLLRVRAR